MAKKNPALPGLERPTIEEIDRACEADQKAVKALAKAKLKAKGAAATAEEVISEHLDKLETDAEGNHIYVYNDGDFTEEYVIPCRGPMRRRKPTKVKEDVEDKGNTGKGLG